MLRARILAALAIAIGAFSSIAPASAAIDLIATFRGTVATAEGSGIFSDVQVGDSWLATYYFDADLGESYTSSNNYILFGGEFNHTPTPLISATLAIGSADPQIMPGDFLSTISISTFFGTGFNVYTDALHRLPVPQETIFGNIARFPGLPPFVFGEPISFTATDPEFWLAVYDRTIPEGFGTTLERYTADITSVSINSVSGIPEPATWAMMVVGFGIVGSLLRRGRQNKSMVGLNKHL